MRFDGVLVPATFNARPNRFLGEVEAAGERARCFIPNPGRMRELLRPAARVYLVERPSPARKTRYDLVLVEQDAILVSVDSRMPNRVVGEAIAGRALAEFRGMAIAEREPTLGESRLDLRLVDGEGRSLFMEVKSCTLVVDGVGLFPDAPTERGSRHLRTLTEALEAGRAAVVFLIQRGDAKALRPNAETDPRFADALRAAVREGVEAYAYTSVVTLEGVSIQGRVPVQLP